MRFTLALLVMAPGAAFGSDPIADDASRWVPSIAFAGGFTDLEADATVDSPQRADSAQGDSGIVMAQVGLDAELMSPQLISGPWGPRLFVHGRFGLIFDTERRVAREGSARSLKFPRDGLPVSATQGDGSTTSSLFEPIDVGAGVGVAFTMRLGDRALRIKPSFEYRRDELELSSRVSDSIAIAGDGRCPCSGAQVVGKEKKEYHSIGPGLEIEVDALRAGPFMLTAFGRTQGLALLGDRRESFGASGFYSNGAPISVDSTYTRDRWTYRAEAGVRLRWLPQ